MKMHYSQKRLALALLTTIALLPVTGRAQHVGDDPKLISAQIKAQITLTADTKIRVIENLGHPALDPHFKNADYKRKNKKTIIAVEAALTEFEKTVKDDVLGPIEKFAQVYNSIVQSPQYSSEQKDALKKEFMAENQPVIDQSTKLYQEAIRKLYSAYGDVLLVSLIKAIPHALSNYDVIHYGSRVQRIFDVEVDVSGVAETVSNVARSESTFEFARRHLGDGSRATLFREKILPLARTDCRSVSCIVLSASEMGTFVQYLNDEINKELNLTLADGERISLARLGSYPEAPTYAYRAVKTVEGLDFGLTLDVILYKWVDVSNLPFDCTEKDLEEAK